MHAKDVMTQNVITVGPDITVQALAALLSERGISGTPVVDSGGRMVGIVSEGDLLHRTDGFRLAGKSPFAQVLGLGKVPGGGHACYSAGSEGTFHVHR